MKVITKGYGVRATTIEGQNALLHHCASVVCVNLRSGVIYFVIFCLFASLARGEKNNA